MVACVTDLTAESTTDEVLAGRDLSGRTYLVTGASSGLGEETARALAFHGASVVMAARNMDKIAAAAARIRSADPDADLELRCFDLADTSSIRSFARDLREEHESVDVLINNAGVMVCPFGLTADGFEMQFGTNHVGHFLLTNLLRDIITDRVITLSSGAHLICDVDLEDAGFDEGEYDPWEAYGRSKSANALFAFELAHRGRDRHLLSFSVHPGMVMTDLSRHLTEDLLNQMMARLKSRSTQDDGSEDSAVPAMRMPEVGAATQVWAATTDDLADHSGAYLMDCRLGSGSEVAGYVTDNARAMELWAFTEELLGESFS